jgi:hypothetical protein
MLWQRLIFFGCFGVLIENVFTGLYSLFQRHWKMTTCSYLPMFFVYGVAGLTLEVLGDVLPWPNYLKALLYVPIIYGFEALSGAAHAGLTTLLQKWFGGVGGGEIPWKYKKSRWAPFQVIQLKYVLFWYLLALSIGPVSHYLRLTLNYLTTAK